MEGGSRVRVCCFPFRYRPTIRLDCGDGRKNKTCGLVEGAVFFNSELVRDSVCFATLDWCEILIVLQP